jgi:excisionase family DNA binding protein
MTRRTVLPAESHSTPTRRGSVSTPSTSRATYSVDETAAILGISRTTAYECIHRGEIPARRFGRRVVVVRDELDAMLHAHSA